MSAAVEPRRNPFEGWPTIPSKYLAPARMAIVCEHHGKHVRTLYNITRDAREGDVVARWSARQTRWQAQRVGNFVWGADHPEYVLHASAVPRSHGAPRTLAPLARTTGPDGEIFEALPLPPADSIVPVTCRCRSKVLAPVVLLTIALEEFHRAGVDSITLPQLDGALRRIMQQLDAINC